MDVFGPMQALFHRDVDGTLKLLSGPTFLHAALLEHGFCDARIEGENGLFMVREDQITGEIVVLDKANDEMIFQLTRNAIEVASR